MAVFLDGVKLFRQVATVQATRRGSRAV